MEIQTRRQILTILYPASAVESLKVDSGVPNFPGDSYFQVEARAETAGTT